MIDTTTSSTVLPDLTSSFWDEQGQVPFTQSERAKFGNIQWLPSGSLVSNLTATHGAWLDYFLESLVGGTGDGGTLTAQVETLLVDNAGQLLVAPSPNHFLFSSSYISSKTGRWDDAPYVATIPEVIERIRELTGYSDENIGWLLDVSRQTIFNWRTDHPISLDNHRGLLAICEVLETAFERYPSPKQLNLWLHTPRGKNGITPAEHLRAGEIDKARFLAVSVPSPSVKRAPDWAYRPIAETFQDAIEYRREIAPKKEEKES